MKKAFSDKQRNTLGANSHYHRPSPNFGDLLRGKWFRISAFFLFICIFSLALYRMHNSKKMPVAQQENSDHFEKLANTPAEKVGLPDFNHANNTTKHTQTHNKQPNNNETEYVMPLAQAAPSDTLYRAELLRDPHNTPVSLINFAEYYVGRKGLVAIGQIGAYDFCKEIVECISDSRLATPARAYCLEHFYSLHQEFSEKGAAQPLLLQCQQDFADRVQEQLGRSPNLQRVARAARGFQ